MPARVWGFAAVSLALAGLTCGSDPEPPELRTQPQLPAQAQPGPVEAKPERAPDGCRVTVDGGEDLRSAMVSTKSWFTNANIADGHQLTFECPPIAERSDADIVAEMSTSDVVHWPNVDLTEDGRTHTRVKMKQSKVGIPADWTADRVEQYRAEHPHLPIWNDVTKEVSGGEDAPPLPAKVRVTFLAHELHWAVLMVAQDGRKRRVELSPTGAMALLPGNCRLAVQRVPNGRWEDAGELEVDAKHGPYTVKMMDNPPRAVLTTN